MGDSFDNALAENLWSTLKTELVLLAARDFATRAEAGAALIRSIDDWYNPRHIQEGLGALSPEEYADAWRVRQHTPPATIPSTLDHSR